MEPTQDAIGKILGTGQERDAIHIAVAPVKAAKTLHPGRHVGLNKDGDADPLVDTTVGIVDPYLTAPVKPGERFFIFLYPNTITGLRHVWTHPVLDSKEALDKSDSEKWLREFAVEHFSGYDRERGEEECYAELMRMAKEGDFCVSGQPDWLYSESAQEKQELWGHLEVVLGRQFSYAHKASAAFRCSC